MFHQDMNDDQSFSYQDPDQSLPYQSNDQSLAYQNTQQTHQTLGTTDMRGQPPSSPRPTGSAPSGPRTGAIIALTVAILLVFSVGLFAGWQFHSSSSPISFVDGTGTGLQPGNPVSQVQIPKLSGNNIEAVREAVIANVRPAVVQINVSTQQGNALGSGVIIDKRGYIVTNNHVVAGAQAIQVVLYDGTKLNGQLVGTDSADDLAVLKINPPAKMAVATLGDSSQLRVRQDVLAIGNPLGNTQTVTNGIVSALGRNVDEPGGSVIPNAIQTDAPINPGNSGGALVDLQGHLIGIPTLTAIDPEFRTPASGVGFAIPSNRVNFVVPQIIQNGNVTHTGRAALNVRIGDVDPQLAAQDNLAIDHGALIESLINNGAAAQAGLQVGDVIVQINSTQINGSADLSDALVTKNPGETVQVKVYRGNQQLTVNVKLGELQAG